MKSRWITHKGKRIFIADYSNFGMDSAALKVELDAVVKTLIQEPLDSVLSLSDFRGSHASPETLAFIKAALAQTNKHVHKRAIVGFTGVRKMLLEVMSKFTGPAGLVPWDDMESAQDWLVR